jgi:hypothetical protein
LPYPYLATIAECSRIIREGVRASDKRIIECSKIGIKVKDGSISTSIVTITERIEDGSTVAIIVRRKLLDRKAASIT